jgi:hypothetical protein
MSDVDKKLAEIRARHAIDQRWHGGPSMICPQSHEDRGWLLTEIERLKQARSDALAGGDALRDEITRLREQLHLANIDAIGAHAEANDLRDRISTLSELLSEYMRACGSLVSPRIEKKAIAALEAKP